MDISQLIKAVLPYRFFWIICLFLMIFNIAVYIVVIKNQRKEIINLQDRYTAERKKSVSLSRKNDAVIRYYKAKESLTVFREKLPAMETIADQVRQIKDIVNRHGLSAEKMTFKPDREKTFKLWKYTASFTVSGTYAKLKTFLADVQNLHSIFCIEDLSLSRFDDTKRVKMRLRIATYCR